MKLYTNVERVYNELAELGKVDSDPLTVSELSALDQLHYHGTDALDTAIRLLGIHAGQEILEIGSGIGGPARYLAQRTEARITALELQADQHEVALDLTRRCEISENIIHRRGNFLTQHWSGQCFDTIVSWLALYHIPERDYLLARCRDILKPGGKFYTEDLCSIGEFNREESDELERELYAITLPEMGQYRQDVTRAGFEIELFEDMTDDWAALTHQRLDAYRADRSRHVRVHGEATVDALDLFYSTVDKYFQSGKLAGVRLCARRV
ncbi:MAG: cyclopropane-fatty-acyl-phospholipid synthase family protein [Gammaproteobacteria bacterium]